VVEGESPVWPRVIELMLGCWLVLSPFIFRHDFAETMFWWNDMCSGALVVTFSLTSFARRFHYAHFGTLIIALWLIGFAYLTAGHPAPAAQQNELATGLLLLMFAIVPSEVTLPPPGWRGVPPEDPFR
jgi:hypothetical protein